MQTDRIVPISRRVILRRQIPAAPQSPKLTPQQELAGAFFSEAAASPNPVLKSVVPVVQSSGRHVSIDAVALLQFAKRIAGKPLEPSNWKMPNYIQEDSEKTVQFFMVENAINFKFWGKDSTERYSTEYKGIKWEGSAGMVASLTRALDEGIPVLDADYLSKLTMDQARHIFRGNMEIPMLKERVANLNNVGQVLKDKYNGSFYNLYKSSGGYAFNNGKGMVEQLVSNFDAFKDTSVDPYTGKPVEFDKRAQLAVMELSTRLKGTGLFDVKDLQNISPIADYQVPKTLHQLGILTYRPALEAAIKNGKPIPSGSREEIEIRANTVCAARMLEIALKKMGKNVNVTHVDYLLWSEGRGMKDIPHHLTETTAY